MDEKLYICIMYPLLYYIIYHASHSVTMFRLSDCSKSRLVENKNPYEHASALRQYTYRSR